MKILSAKATNSENVLIEVEGGEVKQLNLTSSNGKGHEIARVISAHMVGRHTDLIKRVFCNDKDVEEIAAFQIPAGVINQRIQDNLDVENDYPLLVFNARTRGLQCTAGMDSGIIESIVKNDILIGQTAKLCAGFTDGGLPVIYVKMKDSDLKDLFFNKQDGCWTMYTTGTWIELENGKSMVTDIKGFSVVSDTYKASLVRHTDEIIPMDKLDSNAINSFINAPVLWHRDNTLTPVTGEHDFTNIETKCTDESVFDTYATEANKLVKVPMSMTIQVDEYDDGPTVCQNISGHIVTNPSVRYSLIYGSTVSDVMKYIETILNGVGFMPYANDAGCQSYANAFNETLDASTFKIQEAFLKLMLTFKAEDEGLNSYAIAIPVEGIEDHKAVIRVAFNVENKIAPCLNKSHI